MTVVLPDECFILNFTLIDSTFRSGMVTCCSIAFVSIHAPTYYSTVNHVSWVHVMSHSCGKWTFQPFVRFHNMVVDHTYFSANN